MKFNGDEDFGGDAGEEFGEDVVAEGKISFVDELVADVEEVFIIFEAVQDVALEDVVGIAETETAEADTDVEDGAFIKLPAVDGCWEGTELGWSGPAVADRRRGDLEVG